MAQSILKYSYPDLKTFLNQSSITVCNDTIKTVMISQVSIDMPIITEICFDINSTLVKREYLYKTTFDPPLTTLAQRLKQNHNLKVNIKGFADQNSGEIDIDLANKRATAVRDSMVYFGVNSDQVQILPGEVLLKRRVPSNPTDAKWVFEERRCVKITSDQEGQAVLFQPIHFIDNEEIYKSVYFISDIKSEIPFGQGYVICSNEKLKENISITNIKNQRHFQENIEWDPSKTKNSSYWLFTDVKYCINLTDTLGRVQNTRRGGFPRKGVENRFWT